LRDRPWRRKASSQCQPFLLKGRDDSALKISLWTADGNAQLINVVMSLDAAHRVYDESIAKLRAGEVIRVRDAAGALVLSTDPTE